ncbi:MAG: tetratricopeptide repeat protein [Myxococcota bacterium]
MAEEEHRPTVLLVGQGEPMQAALGEALRRHGVSVAASASDELENAVRVYAPDLVVLIGDASVRGGANIIQRMAANRATDVLPVAVVSNEAVLKHEGPDFRSGAVAIVPRGAGADTIARRLADLAREVPDRPGLARGDLTEENLKDVVSLVASDHKTGILSIQSASGVVEGMPMVVETESPSAHNMEVVLDRLREAMDQSEELQYEFHEASGGRLSTLPAPLESIRPGEPVDLGTIEGARMVILDSDELRAEKFAHVLHARGVKVAAADFSTAVIPRIREVDPQVIVLDSTAVGGQGIEFVRAIRKDPQLRWASILVVRWDDFWPDSSSEAEPDLGQLASRVEPLIEQDAEIPRRVSDEIDFDTRLELIGPGRMLRALGSVAGVRHVAISSNKRNVEIDIADNSIVGAYATLREDTVQNLQGIPALTALWGMNSGRVSVREQDLPSVANIMMPVDEALGVVARELGMTEGVGAIVGDAPTVPPAAPEVQEQATVPPGAISTEELDELRTMAPPRFRHLQAAAGAEGQAFTEDEAPTNKVPRMLARVETERRAVTTSNGGIRESNGPERHTDHGLGRPARKATQMGLAPTFEALPEEGVPSAHPSGQSTGSGSKTPPPPPLDSRKPSPGPLFADESFEHELAPMLEGPATILAPAEPGSNQAWILVLLLVAVVGGLGFAAWQFWLRADSGAVAEAEVERDLPPPAAFPADEPPDKARGETGRESDTKPSRPAEAVEATPEAPQEEPSEDQNDDRPIEDNAAEQAGQPDVEDEADAEAGAPDDEPADAPSEPLDPSMRELLIPTQNLPRDPSRASDVLVHRALPLIRKGQLQRAEATLDRAWELDPRNPQAMAGYATLYVAAGDGEAGEKWAKRAVAKRPRRVQYRVLLGDALMLQDRPREARKAWRKVLDQDPDNRAARSRLKRGGGGSTGGASPDAASDSP